MIARIRIAMLLTALAVAGWRPLQEQKATFIRSVHAIVINSVVRAQSEAALEQNDFRENLAAVRADRKLQRGSRVASPASSCACRQRTLSVGS